MSFMWKIIMNLQKNILGVVSEFSKVVRYKAHTQKHQRFSYVGTKILEYIKFKKFSSCEDRSNLKREATDHKKIFSTHEKY